MRRALVVVALAGCGDRSPPALWPEAPPPTLATPIGIDVPTSAAPDASAPTGADAAAAAAPTSADSPTPPGGTPASTSEPLPHGRPRMPPL